MQAWLSWHVWHGACFTDPFCFHDVSWTPDASLVKVRQHNVLLLTCLRQPYLTCTCVLCLAVDARSW